MGVQTGGAGVPAVWGYGDDAEAGSSRAVDVLVFGVPAVDRCWRGATRRCADGYKKDLALKTLLTSGIESAVVVA